MGADDRVRVTRQDVWLLRAHLRGQLARTAILSACNPPWRKLILMRAAFVLAVHRRFAGQSRGEVVKFVAAVRIRRGKYTPFHDQPLLAERLIMSAASGAPSGLTQWQTAHYLLLLSELIEDEQLDTAGTEQFIREAVRLASSWPRPERARHRSRRRRAVPPDSRRAGGQVGEEAS